MKCLHPVIFKLKTKTLIIIKLIYLILLLHEFVLCTSFLKLYITKKRKLMNFEYTANLVNFLN